MFVHACHTSRNVVCIFFLASCYVQTMQRIKKEGKEIVGKHVSIKHKTFMSSQLTSEEEAIFIEYEVEFPFFKLIY